MSKLKNYKAGILFAILGAIFLYMDMAPAMDHSDHMSHTPTHGNTLLGIGEMTWMWFTMAIVHLFLKDCHCKHCKGE
tara:strand:+ start:1498 stop:1728 length:231 start_codon:yes stop_codon:yes gene_type:complete